MCQVKVIIRIKKSMFIICSEIRSLFYSSIIQRGCELQRENNKIKKQECFPYNLVFKTL